MADMSGYAPFHEYCPEMGVSEYRSLHLAPAEDLPGRDFGFMELYCTERHCDCRRVMFWVVTPDRPGKPVATFGYGWESPEFYVKWMDGDSFGARMAGLSMEMLGPQSDLSAALFQACQERLLADPEYVERLRRHYALFRKAVDATGGKRGTASAIPGAPKRKKLRWKH
jgi:hypothetical protein